MFKKRICMKRMHRRPDFFIEYNAPQKRLIKQNDPQARFLTKSSWVLCPVNAVKIYFPQFSAQNLLLLINELINELMN